MEFLGKVGINFNLLIAQMINFGLLLIILTKLLYKPIIKKVEKDEQELKEAKIQKEKLEKEKEIFLKDKQKEIAEAKKLSREIIEKAEIIAKEIKKRAQKEAEETKNKMIQQAKIQLESQKEAFKKEIERTVKKEIRQQFKEKFKEIATPLLQKELENIFFKKLLLALEKLSFEELHKTYLSKILKKSSSKTKFKDLINSKIGPIVLEYAFLLEKEKERKLQEIIAKKIGVPKDLIKITKKENPNLLNGFRLEIKGVVIESNLLNEIENATALK